MNFWEFQEAGLERVLYAIEETPDGEFRYYIKYRKGEALRSTQTYPERQQAYDAAVEKAKGQGVRHQRD